MSTPLFVKDPATGRLQINELKHYVFPNYLISDVGQIVVPAGGTSAPTGFTVTQEGPEEITLFTGQTTANVMVMIQDIAANRFIMNREIHWLTMVGVGMRPFILPQTMMLHQRRSLVATFRDLAAGGANVDLVMGSRRFYPTAAGSPKLDDYIEKKLERFGVSTPYFLTTDAAVNFAALGTQTFRMSVGPEGHFCGYKLMFLTDIVGAFTFTLQDAETGRNLMNGLGNVGLVNSADGIGTAQWPYILPEPWFIERNGAVNITITAAAAGNVWFTIGGIRIYSE